MKFKSKKIRNSTILSFIIIGLTAFFIWQNNDVVVTNYEYSNLKLSKNFEGYTIVQISDFHNKIGRAHV